MNQSGCSTNSQVVWPKLVDHYSGNATLTENGVAEASQASKYRFTVFAGSVAELTQLTVTSSDGQFSKSVDVTLYNYIFKYNYQIDANARQPNVVSGASYQFIVKAVASDNASDVQAVAGNTLNRSLDSTELATLTATDGKTDGTVATKSLISGSVKVTASGACQGFTLAGLEGTLTIRAMEYTDNMGVTAVKTDDPKFLLAPPDYALVMRCGSIVDSVKNTGNEGAGGTGGSEIVARNLRDVKSVKVTSGVWRSTSHISLTQMLFTYKDGTTVTCGNGASEISGQVTVKT
ncbi:MAG: hypothetical protein XXXJIFNMEKO3_01901 [Candidatus Erwinia impunctatus]|nr:hypothetical protein XXXJIFNMEKO_01901 [Culicoides impunctatus]